MSLAERTIAARRARVVEVNDVRGRTIGVRRLPPSEHLRVLSFTHDKDDPAPLLCAASVTFIRNGDLRAIKSPMSEHTLWAIVGLLGEDGLAAVTHAMWLHMSDGPPGAMPANPFRCFSPDLALVPAPIIAIEKVMASLPAPRRPPVSPSFDPEAILPLFHKP